MKKIPLPFASRILFGLAATFFVFASRWAAADGPDGEKTFTTSCAACHQATGAGIPGSFPALANDPVVNGDPDALIRVVLLGPAKVLAADRPHYNSVMPSFAQLSDADIAALLTYIRSNFGNTSSAIDEARVTAVRTALPK